MDTEAKQQAVSGNRLNVIYPKLYYDHLNMTHPIKKTIDFSLMGIPFDIIGEYGYGFSFRKEMIADINRNIHEFYNVYKSWEAYQYTDSPEAFEFQFILDDWTIEHIAFLEYQPDVSTQRIMINDTLPSGQTMAACNLSAT